MRGTTSAAAATIRAVGAGQRQGSCDHAGCLRSRVRGPHTGHRPGTLAGSDGHSRTLELGRPVRTSFLVGRFPHHRSSKPLMSCADAGSGWKIGGGRRPLTPAQLDLRDRFQAGRWEPAHGPFSVASSTRIRFLHSCPSLLRAAAFPVIQGRRQVLAKTQDNEEIIERVAALDIGKAELMCCVRVPDEDHPGRRLQEVDSYSTMTRPLLSMADRLACLGVTRVVMEATSGLLEAGVLPAGGGRVRGVAGQRQGCQAPARAAEDRSSWIASGCVRPPSGR